MICVKINLCFIILRNNMVNTNSILHFKNILKEYSPLHHKCLSATTQLDCRHFFFFRKHDIVLANNNFSL